MNKKKSQSGQNRKKNSSQAHSAQQTKTPNCSIGALQPASTTSYFVAILVFLFMFAFNWFVVEKYFSTPSASSTRTTALIGSNTYQSKGRDQIAVVELNDTYLQWQGVSWPPSYTLYKHIFEDIAQYQPKSIFLDIALIHSRNDSGVHALIDTLCRIAASGTRIYLAALIQDQDQLHLRPEFMEKVAPMMPTQPCFELVDVRYTPDDATHLTTNYPLLDKGQPPSPSSQARPIPSAAFAMARDVWLERCLKEKPSPTDEHAKADLHRQCMQAIVNHKLPQSIGLTWGMGTHEEKRYRQWEHCNTQPSFLIELIPLPIRKIWSEPKAPCPFHPHVPLRMLSDPDSDTEFEELQNSLQNHHVMIGAVVSGINDAVNAPINGYIPGVYLHAMALDNLLTDYPNLKSSENGPPSLPWFFWILASVLSVVCFLIYEILHKPFHLEPTCKRCNPQPTPHSLCEALTLEIKHFCRWAGLKFLEILSSLVLLWAVMFCLLNSYPYSVQTLAQVMAVVFSLQWTGITAKVFKSASRIFKK